MAIIPENFSFLEFINVTDDQGLPTGETYIYPSGGAVNFSVNINSNNSDTNNSYNNTTSVAKKSSKGVAAIIPGTTKYVSEPEEAGQGSVYSRAVFEGVGLFDQKAERLLSTGVKRPHIVERVEEDSESGEWLDKQALTQNDNTETTFLPNTATVFSKLWARDFRVGIPQNAEIRGFVITVKRKKRLSSNIQEDAGTPLIEEDVKIVLDKWQLDSVG